jgi:rfaE bifunctional protein kinase chain/domain
LNIKPFTQLTKERLYDILGRYRSVRIAVVGDFCLDVYWILDMSASEVSIETDKMTQPVREQRYSLGGAGNVVANLHDLGVGEIYSCGVVGDDPFGHKMLSLLKERSNCDHVLISGSESWQTLAYCKPYIGDEELQRVDMGQFNRLPDALAEDLINKLEDVVSAFDIIIINEQVVSGIHTPFFRERLARMVSQHRDTIFMVDGRHVQDTYNGAWLKMNAHEALRMSGKKRDANDVIAQSEMLEAVEAIFKKINRPVVVTRGARGCVICTNDGIVKVPGIRISGKIDPVGAGDSFLAGMSASLACGADVEEAAQMGNLIAAVTITKIGRTGTATPEEILRIGTSPNTNDE